MVITKPAELKKTLNDIRPTYIAVAYLGDGWDSYLKRMPQELVVSPTVGSNPRAIRAAIRRIGIDHVHFLDDLHAKIYLGKNAALVGSCNLSGNGFDGGHKEAAVLVKGESQINQLHAVVARYIDQARRGYPTEEKKWEQLKKLDRDWKSTPPSRNGRKAKSKKTPSLEEYLRHPSTARIHIVWCQSVKTIYNKNVIRENLPEAKEADPADFIEMEMWVTEEDDIRNGDWTLLWRCRNDGSPRKNSRVDWMFVDRVIPHGIKNGGSYTKLVCQLKEEPYPTPPFCLNDRVKARIRQQLPKFPALLSVDDEAWYLKKADAVVPEFLKRLQSGKKG